MEFQVAIKEKHLVYWNADGFVRTLEPHMYAQIRGGENVLFALQIAGGPTRAKHPRMESFKVDRTRDSRLQNTIRKRASSASPLAGTGA